jgi:hypothetical protein
MTSSSATDASAGAATRENLGFLLAKASQRWNELLYQRFAAAGYPDVRPSYGSVLVPLFEEDGLRMGELAARARLSKQTITTIVRCSSATASSNVFPTRATAAPRSSS